MITFRLFRTEFGEDNFKFDEKGREFPIRVENTVGKKEKLLVTSNFSFSHSVFKGLVQHTRKNKGLFGKGLSVAIWIMEMHQGPFSHGVTLIHNTKIIFT